MADKSIIVDSVTFSKRVKLLIKWLNKEESDTLLVISGNDTLAYSKTLSIHIWLFGCFLPNSAFILSSKKLHILASKKVGIILKAVIDNVKDLEICFMESNDDTANIAALRESIETLSGSKPVAHLARDLNFEGKFFKLFKEETKKMKVEFIDVSESLSNFFAVKNADELEKIKTASEATANLFQKSLKNAILDAVYEGKKVKHSELTSITEEAVKKEAKENLEGLDVCYPPIVQSGGTCYFGFDMGSDNNDMHNGVIVCSMGLRYDYYCSNIIRTLMINATAEQKELYEYLVDQLYVFALEQIQPGKQFGEVSKSIERKLAIDRPNMRKNLFLSFGFATGVEFKDRFLTLLSYNYCAVFRKNMVLVFYVALTNLECAGASDKRARTYSIWVGDTVVVGGGEAEGENREVAVGGNLILTGGCRRRNKDNLLQLKEEAEEEPGLSEPLGATENYRRGQKRGNTQQQQNEDNLFQLKEEAEQESTLRRIIPSSRRGRGGTRGARPNINLQDMVEGICLICYGELDEEVRSGFLKCLDRHRFCTECVSEMLKQFSEEDQEKGCARCPIDNADNVYVFVSNERVAVYDIVCGLTALAYVAEQLVDLIESTKEARYSYMLKALRDTDQVPANVCHECLGGIPGGLYYAYSWCAKSHRFCARCALGNTSRRCPIPAPNRHGSRLSVVRDGWWYAMPQEYYGDVKELLEITENTEEVAATIANMHTTEYLADKRNYCAKL